MSNETRIDATVGEYKIENGVEMHSIWLPITAAEMQEIQESAKAKGIEIPQLLADFFRAFLAAKE